VFTSQGSLVRVQYRPPISESSYKDLGPGSPPPTIQIFSAVTTLSQHEEIHGYDPQKRTEIPSASEALGDVAPITELPH
jgi:hypothetical protein